MKADLRDSQGLGAALAAVSAAVALAPDGSRIVVDKLQDDTRAPPAGVTFIPSVFGSPHLVAVHAPGWRPVVQYPLRARRSRLRRPASLDTVEGGSGPWPTRSGSGSCAPSSAARTPPPNLRTPGT